jgi:hypothetical protein
MCVDENDYVKLSNSAHWWNNYDFDLHNWSNNDDVENAKKTFHLIENEFELKIFSDYIRIASFYDRLYLLFLKKFAYL